MTPNQMFVGRLVLLVVSITAITTVTMLAWGGAPPDRASRYEPPAPALRGPELGARLFQTKGCVQCHSTDGSPKVGPSLAGSFGSEVALADGRLVIDEAYIRESLIAPYAKARLGYQQVMPSFDGLLRENEIVAIIEYIKSLRR